MRHALIHAGAMVTAQYLACLCDIAACLSGSQEVAELAHCTDNIAQVCNSTLTSASHLVSGLTSGVILFLSGLARSANSRAHFSVGRSLLQSLLDWTSFGVEDARADLCLYVAGRYKWKKC